VYLDAPLIMAEKRGLTNKKPAGGNQRVA